ncbi:c-type cytochrome [Frateuria aurantia]
MTLLKQHRVALSRAGAWLAGVALVLGMVQQPARAADDASTANLVEHGHQLAIAADCQACHTDSLHGGKPFAGGYSIHSPLGIIYATNITPSRTAGIGDYSEKDFARALRQGIRRDGAHLYPAMPYTSYTQLSDADVHALYAYFMQGVTPVDVQAHVTHLPFPFSIRASMAVWNALYLHDVRFKPDPSQSAAVNRGAYLAGALEHCDACHTPRGVMMAEQNRHPLAGGAVGPWFAPNISSDPVSGIGGWSDAQLFSYLKTGRAPGVAQAAGGMAEAIEHSLQYLPDGDIHDLIAYLRTTPAQRDPGEQRPAFAFGQADSLEPGLRGLTGHHDQAALVSGAELYSGFCASCHQPDGSGSANQAYPSLFHNTATGLPDPSNLVSAILFGVDRSVAGHQVLMPRFDQQSYVAQLSDAQVADIANYVLQHFGNSSNRVSAEDVYTARGGGRLPWLARLQPCIIPGMIAAVVLLVLIIGGWRFRRRRR